MANHEIYTLLPEHEETHKALLNWASWCRVHYQQQRCRSLESRYKSPPQWHPPEPINHLDILLAHRIEDLVTSAPKQYGKHLKFWYIVKLSPFIIKKRLHIKDVDQHLHYSREYIKKHLTGM